MLFTHYLLVVYMLFTCCLLVVYLLFTCCLLVVYLLFQAKQRKIKEKYKHQDEEERRLKMEILAVSYIHCEIATRDVTGVTVLLLLRLLCCHFLIVTLIL